MALFQLCFKSRGKIYSIEGWSSTTIMIGVFDPQSNETYKYYNLRF